MGIQNKNFCADTAQVLKTERVILFDPGEQDWKYAHHAFLTWFKGKFYCMWSSGRVHEDLPGQRVMITSSADFVHWEKPEPLVDTQLGEHTEYTYIAGGFYTNGETLNCYVGRYEIGIDSLLTYQFANFYVADRVRYQKCIPPVTHHGLTLFALTSTDGVHFSKPIDLKLPVISNHPPEPLQNGRLLLCGSVCYPYSDNGDGISGFQMTGIYPPDFNVHDDSEGIEEVRKFFDWKTQLCESSFYQLPDGRIQMLLRSEEQVLYCTRSEDNGESWCAPFKTEFTNDNAKFKFGRLPDGRYYYIGNPLQRSVRNPLVLSLSENGMDFTKHYILESRKESCNYEGIGKAGTYGYPETFIHDGYFYAVYSIQKEKIAVSRVPLTALD